MRGIRFMTALLLLTLTVSCAGAEAGGLPFWRPSSPAAGEIVAFVDRVTDVTGEAFVPPEERVAVFDFDGTLYGERFPTYFDHLLLLHRGLHDPTYQAPAETREYLEKMEEALRKGEKEPKGAKSNAQYAAEAFAGMTVEEYRSCIRTFAGTPAAGFTGMTYAEGFFEPMKALVRYLAEKGFRVYILSAGERHLVRELAAGPLGEWIPPERIIGSQFSLTASGQGDTDGRKYTLAPEDEVVLGGQLVVKTEQMNKVISIINEIGRAPILVFGNSGGDLAMAEYAVKNGGKAFMLLCDDTERDYGDPAVAEKFKEECQARGFTTVSMQEEFETIYPEGVEKQAEEALLPAA